MKKRIIKWYCYICASHIGKKFRLISMSESCDRVFILCDKQTCFEQVEDNYTVSTKVERK